MSFIGKSFWTIGLIGFPLGLLGTSESVHFNAPEVVQLDWSTRAMTSGDFDADGLRDIAVLNNDSAQVELLYQLDANAEPEVRKRGMGRNRWEPILEDARFEVERITVGFSMFDLAVGDMNRDGREDLVYTSREVPLTVRLQGADQNWVETLEFDELEALGWVRTLAIDDLDGDGNDELVVLSADAIRIFESVSGDALAEPTVYYLTGTNPFNLMVHDVTGDGLSDLMYLSKDEGQSLALRVQQLDGAFGPERRHRMERPVRMLHPLQGGSGDQQLVSVDSRSGILEFFELRRSQQAGGLFNLGDSKPDIYPVFEADAAGRQPAYTVADFGGANAPSLVLANPEASELLVFQNRGEHFRKGDRFPAFSDINSLVAGRFFRGSRQDLIVVSEEEKTLGISVMGERGRLSFPRQIDVFAGDPLVAEAIDLNRDGLDELVVVGDQGNRDYRLSILCPTNRSERTVSWELLRELPLAGIRRAPDGLVRIDIFGDEGPGILVTVPREPPVLLAPEQAEAFAFRLIAENSTIRESLLNGVDSASISVFDSNGDGTRELVVARTGFARAYGIEGDELVMLDQFNARRGSDVIGALIPHFEGNILRALALYVESAGEVQFLRPHEDGVFRYAESKKVGRIELAGVTKVGRGNGVKSYLFVGEDRFWFFPKASVGQSWELVGSYESDLEDIHYSHVASADFDGDGNTDLVALDANEHVVEILTGDREWPRSQLYWQVFEQNMHYQGRKGAKLEPREILIDDFNSDGRMDLSFLVHDRLLTYLQESDKTEDAGRSRLSAGDDLN